MPFGLFDNKGKFKKGTPLLMAILGITIAISGWGITTVYANNTETVNGLKDKVSKLQDADTEILKEFNGKVENIYKEMQRTGIKPETVTTLLDSMKQSQQEVFRAQIESQSVLLDGKIEKATQPIVQTQQQIQENMAEVIGRFEQQQQSNQQQQQQLSQAVGNFKQYTDKQEQINIRNAQQMGEVDRQLKENKKTADNILKALADLQKTIEKQKENKPKGQ